jgi:3-hydroxyisobutyrate dehydrogenase
VTAEGAVQDSEVLFVCVSPIAERALDRLRRADPDERSVTMATVAVIGLGNMGAPMAGNLAKTGHTVRGYDVVAANLDGAAKRGVAKAASAAAAVDGADVVITMLPAGKHVLDVYASMLGAVRKGATVVDCSTIDVASARKAHEMAAAAGVLSLDCPVSGGVGGAEAATLTLMAGGSKAAFDAAKPVLDACAKRVVHCGDAGAGQAAKICNNMILGISMIGVAEAFVLAEKLGLSHQALFDVASTSSGQCWSLTTYCPVPGPVPASPANNAYKPGFASALMVKDLKLAQEAAAVAGAATPMGANAAQLYQLFAANGAGDVDFSGIIQMIRGRTQ